MPVLTLPSLALAAASQSGLPRPTFSSASTCALWRLYQLETHSEANGRDSTKFIDTDSKTSSSDSPGLVPSRMDNGGGRTASCCIKQQLTSFFNYVFWSVAQPDGLPLASDYPEIAHLANFFCKGLWEGKCVSLPAYVVEERKGHWGWLLK